MEKKYIFLLACLFTCMTGLGQAVSVTGGTNTTPNLAATYTSLANAVTALNTITAISGPVSIMLNSGNPQTAPAGGYVIQFSAVTTATNYVEFYGNSNTITAFSPQSSGSLNDAIFKLVGVDNVYIYYFNMVENPSNSTTAIATNNMTEWGIALLRASQTNGCHYIHIALNSVTLNRGYRNTFGIYSSVMHAPGTPTTQQDITSFAGSNSYDTLTNNTFSACDYGAVFIGSATAAYMDKGNCIGGLYSGLNNNFLTWGATGTTPSAYPLLPSTTAYGIMMYNQVNETVEYNTITSATVAGGTYSFGAIQKNFTSQPSGTITADYEYNTITISSANTSGDMTAISSDGITSALGTATITITNNSILNCALSGASTSSSFTGIANSSYCGILDITDNVIKGITSTATTGGYTGISNSGNVTDSINITTNYFGAYPTAAVTFSAATTGTVYGINNTGAASTTVIVIDYNRIDNITAVSTGQVFFINSSGATGTSVEILTNTFGAFNTALSFSAAQNSTVNGINVQGTTSTGNVTIQSNWFRAITHSVTGNALHQFISLGSISLNAVISDNIFDNLAINTTNGVFFIINSGGLPAGGTCTINNNHINTAFSKTASGGNVDFYFAGGPFVNNSTITETGNNFSNVTVTGTTQISAWASTEGISTVNGPSKTITSNTFNNINGGSGPVTIMSINGGAATNCSFNTINNISGTGAITAIFIGTVNGQGTFDCASNNISSLVSSGTGGNVKGITGGATAIPTLNINNNFLTTFSSTGASAVITGIEIQFGSGVNIYSNSLFSYTGTGTTSPVANAITVGAGSAVNVYKNYIYTIAENGAISTTSPAVNGIVFSGGGTITAYNNFVSNLKAPAANLTDAIRVVSITSAAANSTYNLYYNSLNVAATSTGTNFGTTTLYHAASATATTAKLNLVDNIFNNASTPNGTGLAVVFRRSATTLGNYATTSDYNDFYSGTPSATKLIYYDGINSDQTMAAFQARVSTREANSISVLPQFTAVTELHLRTDLSCAIDGRGTPIAAVTTDIDNTTRDATTPDMGADEINPFYFINSLAGVNGAAVCENKTVSATGSTYAYSSTCNLISSILPSGADPVSGAINACVTLDATQQYFNAEPYVQRHYDIEPLVSNTTTTSATITLYFTDAEFVNFNTNNPAWPKLPTVAGGGSADPNISNLKVTQYHGTPTTTPSKPGYYTSNSGSGTYIDPPDVNVVYNGWYWAVTFDVTGFSGFYVHTNIRYPLPITINYFRGMKQGGDLLLSWKITCNSTPRVTMTLEKSADAGGNFYPVYTITADAVRCNQPFDYIDAGPLKGMNYYRLKIVDNEGKISYSNTIALLNAASGSALISIAPDPVTGNGLFKLNMTNAQAGKTELIISDMQGRIVKRQTVSYAAGYNSIDMDAGNLAPGIYYIRNNSGDTENKTLRFVKQ